METTIHIGGRKHVEPASVIFLIADQNYTKLIMENGEQHFVATTLKKLQARLQAAGDFFRPNRGNLLNLNYMATYTETSITMADNQTFKITRRRQSAFLHKISSNSN
jgi:DNA-binding LytR/AlgR family response regulator